MVMVFARAGLLIVLSVVLILFNLLRMFAALLNQYKGSHALFSSVFHNYILGYLSCGYAIFCLAFAYQWFKDQMQKHQR